MKYRSFLIAWFSLAYASGYLFALSENPQQVFANDAAEKNRYGTAVAIDGNTMIVGAEAADLSGAAYIYTYTGGQWSQRAKLVASDISPNHNANFGTSVDLDGDYAIVGAVYKNAAYIYKRVGTAWNEHAILKGTRDNARFGGSVQISGDYAIVGDFAGRKDGGIEIGSAHIYKRTGDNWAKQADLYANDLTIRNYFGDSVAIDGDYAIIGAYPYSHLNPDHPGAAYVFKRDGDVWSQQARLIADDAQSSAVFGWQVDLDGEHAIIGAVHDDAKGVKSGSAYIFRRSGTSWIQEKKLVAFDGASGDRHGFSISIQRDWAVMSSVEKSYGSMYGAGAVYLYQKISGRWEFSKVVYPPVPASEIHFGYAVEIDDPHLGIGAYTDEYGIDSGSVFVFERQAPTYSGGSGTVGDPYQIQSMDDLHAVSFYPEHWNAYFVMTADIDASTINHLRVDAGFLPIGNATTKFTGSFDGQGYKIENLYINRETQSHMGLFGYVEGATLENLEISNANVTGMTNTGALVGIANTGTTIRNCKSSGVVVGHDNNAGGLIGYAYQTVAISDSSSSASVRGEKSVGGFIGRASHNTDEDVNKPSIVHCFATGNVEGEIRNIGGFIGWNTGLIDQCYATGNVHGTHATQSRVGGFVGANAYHNGSTGKISNCYAAGNVSASGNNSTNYPGLGGFTGIFYNIAEIRNCYSTGAVQAVGSNYGGFCGRVPSAAYVSKNNFWDVQSSGLATSKTNATGVTSAQLRAIQTLYDAGWDQTIWSNHPVTHVGYPILYQNNTHQFSGVGSEQNPYIVASLFELRKLSDQSSYWSSHFRQTADIDASATLSWGTGAGFSPIGDATTKFTGSFDGQGHKINNLYINRGTQTHIGLFGYVEGATIKNLEILHANVTGMTNTGALLGRGNAGTTISNCKSSGTVVGLDSKTGGLVGYAYQAVAVLDSSSSANIRGEKNVGGFIGMSHNNTDDDISKPSILRCFATGDVEGGLRNIGGFIGFNTGLIDQCYATGNVHGTHATQSRVGGFVGANAYYNGSTGKISNCHADGDVSLTGNNSTTTPGIGGFAGIYYNKAEIRKCYSIGQVQAVGNNYGGFCGRVPSVAYISENNFWDVESSGLSADKAQAKGLTTEHMQRYENYIAQSWDFMGEAANGNQDVWGINETENNGYPFLGMRMLEHDPIRDAEVTLNGYTSSDQKTFILGGKVIDFGITTGTGMVHLGFCYSKTPMPTLDDDVIYSVDIQIDASFEAALSNLTPGARYFVRAFIFDPSGEAAYSEDQYLLQTADPVFPAGSGSASDPFHVSTPEHLYNMRYSFGYYGDKNHFIQVNDIDLSTACAPDGAYYNEGKGWEPIGSEQDSFNGSYNGNRHVISGLRSVRRGEDNVGLFGSVSDAHLHDINLVGVNIVADRSLGALAGHVSGTSSIVHCQATGVVVGASQAGGLIGVVTGSSEIRFCSADVEVEGYDDLGGLVGICSSLSSQSIPQITKSYALGSVMGFGSRLGGFIGKNIGGIIEACYASSSVRAHNEIGQVGGFVGLNGLAGGPPSQIRNSYSSSAVSVAQGEYSTTYPGVGGFVGAMHPGSEIVHCYSSAHIRILNNLPPQHVGGFAGVTSGAFTDEGNFWSWQTSGITQQQNTGDAVALSMSEMRLIETFFYAGWDFQDERDNGTNDHWGINAAENGGFPFLMFQPFYRHDPARAVEIGIRDLEISDIEADAVTITGFIPDPGSMGRVYAYGFKIGTEPDDLSEVSGLYLELEPLTETGEFTFKIVSRRQNTTYYVRAYARSSKPLSENTSIYIHGESPNVSFTTPSHFANGSGTESDPYQISNLDELRYLTRWQLSSEYRYLSSHFNLVADIDASETADANYRWDEGNGMRPLGMNNPFTGSFDGQGYTISNLYINAPEHKETVGFFGLSQNARIENLTLHQAEVHGVKNAGILVGTAREGTAIINCHVTGQVNGTTDTGGLIGRALNGVMIENCSAEATVMGTVRVGGFAGSSGTTTSALGTPQITKSLAKGQVHGNSQIGGFVGSNAGIVTASYANTAVTGGSNEGQLGGFVGTLITDTGGTGIIRNCYNWGSVNTTGNHSLNTGLGGFAGNITDNTEITHCYTAASVQIIGNDYGAFIGKASGVYSDQGNFWSIDDSAFNTNRQNAGNATALTTAEMQSYLIFRDAGWDFIHETPNGVEDLWGISPTENQGYPFLLDQGYAHEVMPLVGATSFDSADLTFRSVMVTGSIIEVGAPLPVSAHGFCWSTTPNPTLADDTVDLGVTSMNGSFTATITGLRPETTYYLRTYATNPTGTVYSTEIVFITPSTFTVGSGTSADPYAISSLEELGYLSQYMQYWDKHFIITAPIDATSTATWNGGLGFSPIGNSTQAFTGSLNGQAHSIDGLFINRPADWYAGLFGLVSNGHIQDMRLQNAQVDGYYGAGLLIGRAEGTMGQGSFITNCHVSGTVNGYRNSGGFIGELNGDVVISDSSAQADVVGTLELGGFVGAAFTDDTGGHVTQPQITNSFAFGTVRGELRDLGGFIGVNEGIIAACFAGGSVIATVNDGHTAKNLGGFVGTQNGLILAAQITNCYSTVEITTVGSNYTVEYVGGFIGSSWNSSEVKKSYAVGSIQHSTGATVSYEGGFLGYLTGAYTGEDNFWDVDTSGQSSSAGPASGLSTSRMQRLSTYVSADWDFAAEIVNGTDDIWHINYAENSGYPFLAWQGISHLQPQLAEISMTSVANVTAAVNTEVVVDVTADVLSLGVPTATSYGICWNTTGMPTIQDSTQPLAGLVLGAFVAAIDGLEEDTHYYFRAYITNQEGTSYSNELTITTITRDFAGGSGTLADPYLLESAHQLNNVRGHLSAYFRQTADMDLAAACAPGGEYYNGGDGWEPIGATSSGVFMGHYDGNGKTITGLYINRSSDNNIGLFGYSYNATVQNLGLINVNITGRTAVGGVYGTAFSSNIKTCFTSGLLTATNEKTGGLIGEALSNSRIENSYSHTAVNSTNNSAGGLAGSFTGSNLVHSYATGHITGAADVGGLIGINTGAVVTGCFWDIETSGVATSAGGTGKTTVEMKTQSTFTDAGWDFLGETLNGTSDFWEINPVLNDGYPSLDF